MLNKMQLGQHLIPETRLFPEPIQDVKTVYDSIGSDDTTSLDLAKILGYSSNTTGAYYKRLGSLTGYGLIDKSGKFRVSELGKRIAYPESDYDKKLAIKEAVLHIPLWSELFKKFGKNPPAENFWVQIKNITGVESPIAQKAEAQVRKWYMEDVAQISEDVMTENKGQDSGKQESKGLSSNESNNRSMSQQMMPQGRSQAPENIQEIPFGDDITIWLPKNNIEQAWEFAQEYMKVYLKKQSLLAKSSEKESKSEDQPQES
jgi:hypothetical protein